MSDSGVESISRFHDRQHNNSWDRRKLGLDLRRKNEMYLVALAFSLAGLAVQSAKQSPEAWLGVVDVAGWIAFAATGLD